VRAVVGFGANLGDRLATMRRALAELRRAVHVESTSRVYAAAPVGPAQPEYLNAAALVACDGEPLQLLETLLSIEAQLGRVRGERWGPRTIDLDFLWAERLVVDSPRLVLPHPRLHERAFALAPLLDLVPGARDPRSGEPYSIPPGDVRALVESL
jgi:2-amino-4-hydroxy-6-hydroxymethyldihydropteridine diphosphokinase